MESIKRKIISLTPNRIIYLIHTLRLYPHYLKAKSKNKNAAIPSVDFYSDEKTVDLITEKRMSLSRFGDGEFSWIIGKEIGGYQKYSAELQLALTEVLTNQNPKLLIGIPKRAFDSSCCDMYSKLGWGISHFELLPQIGKYLDENRLYADSCISRPYIDCKKNADFDAKFNNLKKIWNKQNVIIVEGEKTKFGVGNDLLDNANSVRRIICPATNAFEKLKEIESSIANNADKNDLILAALGPAATVLAYDMCKAGYWILDIGHVDIEYMWYQNHALLREPIEGKYVNESGVKDDSDIYDSDRKYVISIIDRVQ